MTAAGAAVGVLTGTFGIGGSSVATPVLAILGVPPLAAVAAPLPATIPAAAVGAVVHVRRGDARPRAAAWTLLGAVPATVAGALLSNVVGGPALLVVSGLLLVAAGLRVLRPVDPIAHVAGTARRKRRPVLVLAAAGVGLATGLLANGGGFLLMPLYLLVFGVDMGEAVGTSLLVVTVLSLPTLAAHWALGHVDWGLAVAFGLGAVPGSVAGSRLSGRLAGPVQQRLFGWFLVAFGSAFVLGRLL